MNKNVLEILYLLPVVLITIFLGIGAFNEANLRVGEFFTQIILIITCALFLAISILSFLKILKNIKELYK